MFVIVSYDISDDKRRTRLHKLLRRYGDAVQYSVFECVIDQLQFDQLRQEVDKIIMVGKDSVRYYDICQACKQWTKTLGKAITTSIQTVYIF